MNKFEWHRAFTGSGLGLPVIAVGVRVWDYTDANGEHAHPGISALAADLKISRSTVIRHLDTLRVAGWLVRSSKSNTNPHRDWSDIYSLAVPSVTSATRPAGPSRTSETRTRKTSVTDATRSVGPSITGETRSGEPSLVDDTRSTADRVPSVHDRVPLVNGPSSIHERPGSTSDTPTDLLSPDLESDLSTSEAEPRNPRETEAIGFAEFWHCYPRRAGKGDAIKSYAKALRRTDHETIVDAARRYAADPNRVDQFTAHPATWLNQDRWDDDPLPMREKSSASMTASEKIAGWGDMVRKLQAEESAEDQASLSAWTGGEIVDAETVEIGGSHA